MTITLSAQLEEIVQAEIASGRAKSAEEVVSRAIELLTSQPVKGPAPQDGTLVEFFRRSPLVGVDLDLTRSTDTGRDIPL